MKRLILLFLICYSLFTIHCSLSYGATLLDRVVATVNGEIITWSELRHSIEQEGKGFLKMYEDKGVESGKALKDLEKDFLNSMIDVKLQLQEARKRGLEIKESEVEEAIAEIKKKYNLSSEDFIKSLDTEGFTLEEYKVKLMEQILLSKIVMSEVRSNVLVTDKEIEGFYNANKDKYAQKESVRIRQIFFSLPKDKSQRAEVEAKADKVIKRLKAGEDFVRLAEEFSEDVSKNFGGDLGFIKRGNVLKEIEEMAFSLKAGEVSKPFWSSRGLHIIKVEHEKAREEIKEILFEKAFRTKYEEWLKGLRAKAYIEINL